MAEPTKAELVAQIEELTNRATSAERRCGQLAGELETAQATATQAGTKVAEQAQVIEALNKDLRSTRASLKAYKGSATRAQAAATVLKKQLSPDRRRIGPLKPARNEEHAAARKEALEAAFRNDTTEIVFSDGTHEIRELAPLTITGDAWREMPHYRELNHEPLLEPGDCNRQEMTVRGIGLVNEAGEQVGYCPLHEPVAIGRNQRVMLPHGSVRF